MTRLIASVQVRMGSSRLPGKAMTQIKGKPLLGHLISRLKRSEYLDDIVVATSINSENDIIESYCFENQISCYRGAEEDVLGRTLDALNFMEATLGVEVFGDCPLIDPKVVDFVIEKYLSDNDKPDFVGNDLNTTFPPGMEVEVFKVCALEKANKLCKDIAIREHGTLFIRQNPSIFKVKNINAPKKWNRPELEMEVDTKEDLYVIEKIIDYFESQNNIHYGIEDIIHLLDENASLKAVNANVPRRWKNLRGGGNV